MRGFIELAFGSSLFFAFVVNIVSCVMATDIKKTFLTAFRGVLQATITSSDICYYLQTVVFVLWNTDDALEDGIKIVPVWKLMLLDCEEYHCAENQ